MCYGTEALYIGAALAAAGAATSSYATHQQLTKQDSIAAAGIIKQGDMQKQGENDVSATTGQLAKSNATTQQQTNAQLAAYRSALQQSSGISNSADPNVPGASKAYKASQATAGATAGTYVDALAKSAATTEGTQLERVGENQDMAQTATNLGVLNQQSQEQNYVTQLKVRATQANPWLSSLGTLMSAAGTAFGGAAGMAGGATVGATSAAGDAAMAHANTAAGNTTAGGYLTPQGAGQSPW